METGTDKCESFKMALSGFSASGASFQCFGEKSEIPGKSPDRKSVREKYGDGEKSKIFAAQLFFLHRTKKKLNMNELSSRQKARGQKAASF